jgi:membrane-associated phospholipid phosphatase
VDALAGADLATSIAISTAPSSARLGVSPFSATVSPSFGEHLAGYFADFRVRCARDGTTKGSCSLSDKRSSILKTFLVAVTDFGDAALLIPLGALMLFWLFQHDWRSTIWWAISVGFCVGFTAVLKIFFYGCPPASDMRSPSGHTGFSILIYGAIALVTAVPARGLSRTLAIVLGAGIVLAIAISRLILAIHTFPEVSLGVVIGVVSLMLFARVYFNSPNDHVWPLLVSSGILIAMLHGQELHAEELLHHITSYIGIQCG